MAPTVREFQQALLAMNRMAAASLLKEARGSSESVSLVETIMVPALEHIGEAWETGSVSLSQVYMSGRICEELLDEILTTAGLARRPHPPMALAVLEDYHMLGKRLVRSVLYANRIDPIDYGRIETHDLVRRVERDGIEILLISTLMLPSALQIKELVRLLEMRNLNVTVVVGGAPFRFDRGLVQEVGADATADNASGVMEALREVAGDKL